MCPSWFRVWWIPWSQSILHWDIAFPPDMWEIPMRYGCKLDPDRRSGITRSNIQRSLTTQCLDYVISIINAIYTTEADFIFRVQSRDIWAAPFEDFAKKILYSVNGIKMNLFTKFKEYSRVFGIMILYAEFFFLYHFHYFLRNRWGIPIVQYTYTVGFLKEQREDSGKDRPFALVGANAHPCLIVVVCVCIQRTCHEE